MSNILIIIEENQGIKELGSGLARMGFACSIASNREDVIKQLAEQIPDLVLVDMDISVSSSIWDLPQRVKQEKHLPVIALVSKEMLDSLDFGLGIDDFITKPGELKEIAARIKQVLWRTNNIDSKELIKCGDLIIDLAKCEVSINGKLLVLTYKEYQLLRFLASNKGRVFTREALLNKVWGYDYYGGERTVDVHIRRLRSKIEDSTHTFIETVRNIGYKFRDTFN